MKTWGIFIHKGKQCGPNIALTNENIISSDLVCYPEQWDEGNVIIFPSPNLENTPRINQKILFI